MPIVAAGEKRKKIKQTFGELVNILFSLQIFCLFLFFQTIDRILCFLRTEMIKYTHFVEQHLKELNNPLMEAEMQNLTAQGRFTSEPTSPPLSYDGSEHSLAQNRQRRNNHNSLVGIRSAATVSDGGLILPGDIGGHENIGGSYPPRVPVRCPAKGHVTAKLVLLPGSFQELLELAEKNFGLMRTKVSIANEAEIDGIEVVRDGDHLYVC